MIAIVYAHPYPRHSRSNRAMLEALEGTPGVPGVRVRSLYDLYPDFNINVAAEQAVLAEAQLVVWQHPMHWYGVPPLFKLWMDKVLQHGWAYGRGGDALRGKDCLWVVTTGGMPEDFMRCADTDLKSLAQPLRSAAELCGMRWQEPHAMHGVHAMNSGVLGEAVERYRRRLFDYASAPRQAAPTENAHE